MTSLLIPSFFLWVFSLFNQFGIKPRFGMSQLGYIVAGVVAFFIIKRIGRRFFIANIKTIFWSFFALLIIRRTRYEMTPFFYISVIFIALLPAFIVLRQPDLGNASVFVGVLIFMLLVSDIPKRYLVVSGVILFVLLPFSWFFLHDYQQARILSFIQPHSDTQGDAYNMIQAIITVGSGQFFGKGLGLGTQSRLFFLPENNTDFAFSSLVEQFGFLGGFFVLAFEFILISMLFIRAYKFIGGNDSDTRYKYLFSMGLAFLLCIQTGVNIGMNLGLLPIAGIALPFISYGGSFFVALCIGFALLKS
ncbi:MAG: FtsW/RodA/SpoVE family cell cycle protein [Candidatus Roizmanbacteria bacterium]|nr:FtsW/RodA/SpoVE family cell cycle protein [Candidatus Roizmanbacteria bacterium]